MAYWCGSSKHPVSAIKEELVIVLLGSDADAKASCGNTILGQHLFSESPSSLHLLKCNDGMVLNRRVVVINTPDLHNLILSPEEQSMRRFLHLAVPGLHAILLVVKPGSFTDLKRDVLQKINLIFGAGASEYVIVIFMHEKMEDVSVKDSDSRSVESLIQRCPHHRLQRNGDQSQVLELLENIEKMVEKNGGQHLKIEKKVSQRPYSVSLGFIMLYDRRSQVFDQKIKCRKSNDFERPNMCDLRFVLLGKNDSENNRVRNLILHESEKTPTSLEWQNVIKVSGRVKGRHVIIIDALHLLNPNISEHQLTQTLRECVYLSHPGPHVFILTLQYRDFTEEDMRRVKYVLNTFSQEALKRTIIITTDEETHTSPEIKHTRVHQLVKECEGRHLELHDRKPEWPSEILKMVDCILMKAWVDNENYLICNVFHDVKGTLVEEEESTLDELSRSKAEKNTNSHHRDDGKPKDSQKRRDEADVRKPTTKRIQPTMKKNLNLVLCGSDTTLIVSVSKLLRGKKIKSSQHRTDNDVYVKKAEKIHGHTLSVVELPALSGLTEEKAMHQTLYGLSLCHPGVHAFLLILHAGPLTDEDKTEIEKIQKIFDSREHFIVLCISDHGNDTPDSIKHISESGGQYRLMGLKEAENSKQIPDLLDYIENMKTEPYSLTMHMKAQENRAKCELEKKHKKEMSEMENKMNMLKEKIQSKDAEGAADLECLRIVLIGRTGNGKSAVGNTILGRNEFVSQISSDSVTTVCEKGVGEVDGRSVSVVDTPGLFDTTLSNDQVAEEIMKCVSLSSPGPHVFLIVLSLGRFTKEENDTLDLIKIIFGPKAAQFSIVLFTRGDDLQNESIEDYVKRSNNAELKKLIADCGDRFIVFNNNEKQDRTQVIQLLKMIKEVKNNNQGRFFTNSMLEEAEMNIRGMEEKIKEREREIEAQSETVKAKYDRVMKDMSKRFADEKQRADEEGIKIEKRFREKEEKLRKEFEGNEETEQKKRETEYQKQIEEENQQKAEYHQKIEELKREIEKQRSEYEKQQKQREEDDRKKEEKYRQDQEKMKNEQERTIAELLMKQHEEIKNRDLEKKQRNEEEEEERQRWKRRIKEAENERKEIQEEIKRQQREWENEKKQQMREREEEERKRKEKHEEQLREKQEEMEKIRNKFEREREEERQKIEEERQKQRREREEKEREYEERKQEMKRHYEQLERERKEEWERRKREDEERREEERKTSKRQIEDLKQEREEEMKRRETQRRRREEKEREEMKQEYDEKIKEMKKKQDEARKQLREHQKQHEILEKLYRHLKEEKGEEIQQLQKQVDELKNKPGCAIL